MRQLLQYRGDALLVQAVDLVRLGQATARQQGRQRQPLPVSERHHDAAIQPARRQPCRHRFGGMAGTDLGQVAGLPVRTALQRFQRQVEAGFAHAARIEQASFHQLPALILRRLPVRQVGHAAEHGQVMLPAAQTGVILAVHLHRIEQGLRPARLQPTLQLATEAAEVLVVAVAQRQQSVMQTGQRRGLLHQFPAEPQRHIRRLAIAGSADHEQHASGVAQIVERETVDAVHGSGQAGKPQALRGLSRQLLGKARLAGVHHAQRHVRRTCLDSTDFIRSTRGRRLRGRHVLHGDRSTRHSLAPKAQQAEQAQRRTDPAPLGQLAHPEDTTLQLCVFDRRDKLIHGNPCSRAGSPRQPAGA